MRLHSLRISVDGRVRLVLLLAVVILAVESFASNVSVSTTTFQAQYGLVFDVISSFTALDQGFSNVTVSQIASPPALPMGGRNHLQHCPDFAPPSILHSVNSQDTSLTVDRLHHHSAMDPGWRLIDPDRTANSVSLHPGFVRPADDFPVRHWNWLVHKSSIN